MFWDYSPFFKQNATNFKLFDRRKVCLSIFITFLYFEETVLIQESVRTKPVV